MNVPFLVSNILSGVGMCAMLASTALRSRRKILAVQSVNHALSMAACSLLRGWSGAVQEAVNLVRDLAILQFGKLNRFWQISFVAAALGELTEAGCIAFTGEKVGLSGPLPEGLRWPRPSIPPSSSTRGAMPAGSRPPRPCAR